MPALPNLFRSRCLPFHCQLRSLSMILHDWNVFQSHRTKIVPHTWHFASSLTFYLSIHVYIFTSPPQPRLWPPLLSRKVLETSCLLFIVVGPIGVTCYLVHLEEGDLCACVSPSLPMKRWVSNPFSYCGRTKKETYISGIRVQCFSDIANGGTFDFLVRLAVTLPRFIHISFISDLSKLRASRGAR